MIVRKHSSEWLPGYLAAAALGDDGLLQMLDLAGKVLAMPLVEVKWVCFIRDFNSGEIENPERLMKKTFAGRPRSAGVWLRLRLIDGDLIEGLASNDLSLVAGAGLFLTPPDVRSNTQRIFLPRSSIRELEVVTVIAPAAKRKAEATGSSAGEHSSQESLFP
ncbi:MAG TPA: hypothetical protein VGD59_08340 [Acidisarcina sp.]